MSRTKDKKVCLFVILYCRKCRFCAGSKTFQKESGDSRLFSRFTENPYAEQYFADLSGISGRILPRKGNFPQHIAQFALGQTCDIGKFKRFSVDPDHRAAHPGKIRCGEFFSGTVRGQMRFKMFEFSGNKRLAKRISEGFCNRKCSFFIFRRK